jgi:membrane protein
VAGEPPPLGAPPGPAPPPAPPPSPSRFRAFLGHVLTWEDRFLLRAPAPGAPGRPLRAAQAAILAARRYREDHAGDRAAALAFATLLSILPLLVLALAALGATGVGPESLDAVRRWMLRNFVPDTARGAQDLLEHALASVQGARRGLGAIGLAALVVTGWKLLATLQRTFEQIWGVADLRARLQRMLGFWGAVVVAPFLVALAVLLSGALGALAARGWLPGGASSGIASRLLPFAGGWIGVLVLYRLCAGRRTTWRAAVIGSTAAAVLWEGLRIGFALYLKRALLAKTLLTGMGVIPVFLVWLYLSWVVFLLGAEIAFVVHDYDGALRRCGLQRN